MYGGMLDGYAVVCRASGYKTLGVNDNIKKLFESFNGGSSCFYDFTFDLDAESLTYKNRRINTYCIPLLNFLVTSHSNDMVNKIDEVSDKARLDVDFSFGTALYKTLLHTDRIVSAIYHRFFKELPDFTDEQIKDIDNNMKVIEKAFRIATGGSR